MKVAHNWDHKIITDYLFTVFEKEKDNLLLQAAADTTMRWSLTFVLDYENLGVNNFGGTVNYNKKKRQFDYITYSDKKNYAVIISIASKCYWSAWEHRNWLYKNVPQYYCYNDKKLSEYLLTH
jgi:hypothetical protein